MYSFIFFIQELQDKKADLVL